MIKKILFGILLISTMSFNVCAEDCDYYEDVDVGTYRCIGGVYISVSFTGSDMADIHICEKGLHTECITSSNIFVDGIVSIYDEWIIDDLEFINHDSDMFINVSYIAAGYVRFRICDYGTGEPTPTPTPTPTATPTGTPDGGGEYDLNESEDYSGSLDGTGAGGGQGGIYDSIGRGLGDGGSGNAAVSKSLFYTMIPVLFVIVTIIFIGKLLGIDIGKLKKR
jgi:hypothetical protein